MIGIYNTIALDGQLNGRKTTVTGAAVGDKVLVNIGAHTRISSFIIDGIESTQTGGTPTFDNYVSISGRTAVNYRKATTASATGTSYYPSIGVTLYGGSFDIITGEYTVTHDRMQITSALSWSVTGTAGSNRRFYASLTGIDAAGARSGCYCTYATYSYNSSDNGTFYLYNGRIYVGDNDNRFANSTEFKTWLDSLSSTKPFYIVYPVANITYGVGTKTTVYKSTGANYYWSDIGKVKVTSVEPYIELKRPNDFTIEKENVYAGEYTTGNGSLRADLVGWKYSDTVLTFDELTTDEVTILSDMRGEAVLYFTDSEGDHAEDVLVQGFGNTATRLTLPSGQSIWKNVKLTLRFINAYD